MRSRVPASRRTPKNASWGRSVPLDPVTRRDFEPKFGFNFANVRVFAEGEAASAASDAGAKAFTAGDDVVFDAGRYAPWSNEGRRLLAHELTHVVQQRKGVAHRGFSRPGEPLEQHADNVADRVLANQRVDTLMPGDTGAACEGAVQRQIYSTEPAGKSDPNALIPLKDLITYVKAVEDAYPQDTPQQILTRTRTRYYSGLKFEQLIPGAPHTQPSNRMMTIEHGMSIPAPDDPRRLDRRIGEAAWSHLTARADENAKGDNPSPFIVMPDKSLIDVGHVLLAVDALLHPITSIPFSSYGIPNIDPADWVADMAFADIWTEQHERNGVPPEDARKKPAKPDFNTYYEASAPDADLLGDIDAYGIAGKAKEAPAQRLSLVLASYYGSETTTTAIENAFRPSALPTISNTPPAPPARLRGPTSTVLTSICGLSSTAWLISARMEAARHSGMPSHLVSPGRKTTNTRKPPWPDSSNGSSPASKKSSPLKKSDPCKPCNHPLLN